MTRRPWWKRKRWWAVIAFWLLLPILYAAGLGPGYYAYFRGWISSRTFGLIYEPLFSGRYDRLGWWPDWYGDYLTWCSEQGTRDRYGWPSD